MSSTYGISGTVPLTDLEDDPEILFQNFLYNNWNNTIAEINRDDVGFGYEPDINSVKATLIKIQENFTDINELNLGGSYDQFDGVYDVLIWERDSKWYKTKALTRRYKLRRYIERFIKINKRTGLPNDGIKHLYLLGARNINEPERVDWHQASVTFMMQTWKVDTS